VARQSAGCFQGRFQEAPRFAKLFVFARFSACSKGFDPNADAVTSLQTAEYREKNDEKYNEEREENFGEDLSVRHR
jgi:hypothetical protein